MASDLVGNVDGVVFRPGDAGYAEELAGFNPLVRHAPQWVLAAATTEDVVRGVRFAAAEGLAVHVLNAGHAPAPAIASGLVISMRRLDAVSIDARTRVATLGGGVRWSAVVAAGAPLGLTPVSGSSPLVGAAGFLLGGGLGPLARSHGFGSDYLQGATVVTGSGEVVHASAEHAPDLFWALRGGKFGLGVVTELRLGLVELRTLYGGSLAFAEEHVSAVLEQWLDWTAGADPRVSSSLVIADFPPLETIPEPFRGRRIASTRFVYPGDLEDGMRLARPFRDFAPILLDDLGQLQASELARVHRDPTEPMPTWLTAHVLEHADHALAAAVLREVGRGSAGPFTVGELRHLGEATARDVPEGSAVGGRSGRFTLTLICPDRARFAAELPASVERVNRSVRPWLAAEGNINFVGDPLPPAEVARAWSPETHRRLTEVRKKYDPQGLFAAV